MVIHERVHDQKGAGKWDIGTTRYIPVQGGSRSRLPVQDDPDYRRYFGFVGLDDHLSDAVYQIAALYSHLGGAPREAEQLFALLQSLLGAVALGDDLGK